MDIILTHAHCPDGFVAGYVAKKRYPAAQVIPLDHGIDFEPIIDSLVGKDVLMVDFSFKTREQNIRASQVAKSFRILDHHKTAIDKLEGLDFAVFDIKRSGAGLAWDYLFGKDSPSWHLEKCGGSCTDAGCDPRAHTQRPWWVEYTEVRDLWQWSRYEDSKKVAAYLGTLKFESEDWDKLQWVYQEEAAHLGEGALAHIDHYVREVVNRVQTGFFNGLRVGVANVTYLNCSEVGNEVAKQFDFSLTWFERDLTTIQFSLRSIGDLDVSEISKKFQGGGHKNAAGFTLSIHEGRNLIDAILGRPTAIQEVFDKAYGPRHG